MHLMVQQQKNSKNACSAVGRYLLLGDTDFLPLTKPP
jgi:hypothetical protein